MVDFKGLEEAASFVKAGNRFTVIGHYDADGITASAIAGQMLKRMKKRFDIVTTKQLDEERLKRLKKLEGDLIFVDIGSGTISDLEELLPDKNICVIDHHKPEKRQSNFIVFNPHLFGYDGSNDVSGAGMTYFVAREVDERNKDLSKIAIVGAVGDMQDSKGRLLSLNREILADGESVSEIESKIDIRLFGRQSRPLVKFLSYSSDPFLPGLTADDEACKRFIKSLGIPLYRDNKWLHYVDLSDDEKRRFISALYVYGRKNGVPDAVLKTLVGEVYELVKEKERTELRDAKEFATLLNACGRHDKAMLGVEICMGDRGEAYRKASNLLQRHRRMLRDGIEWVQKHGVKEMKYIYVIDASYVIKDTLIGVISGMLYGASVVRRDKPVIGISVDDEGVMKISSRANWELVRKGLDLGKVMREAAESVGGTGGGHNIAAGASIRPEKKEQFLKKANELVREQLFR